MGKVSGSSEILKALSSSSEPPPGLPPRTGYSSPGCSRGTSPVESPHPRRPPQDPVEPRPVTADRPESFPAGTRIPSGRGSSTCSLRPRRRWECPPPAARSDRLRGNLAGWLDRAASLSPRPPSFTTSGAEFVEPPKSRLRNWNMGVLIEGFPAGPASGRSFRAFQRTSDCKAISRLAHPSTSHNGIGRKPRSASLPARSGKLTSDIH